MSQNERRKRVGLTNAIFYPERVAFCQNATHLIPSNGLPSRGDGTARAIDTLDPDNRSLMDERGKLAFKEGDLPLAAKLLKETQNGDALARHFNNLAISLTHQGKFDQGIQTYENAMKLLADRAKLSALRFNLGLALIKKGELARGFEELAKTYLADPKFEKPYIALVRASKQMAEKGMSYDKQLAKQVNQTRKDSKSHPLSDSDAPKK